jgi:hypothetical protein
MGNLGRAKYIFGMKWTLVFGLGSLVCYLTLEFFGQKGQRPKTKVRKTD